jgi:hypothetical protein
MGEYSMAVYGVQPICFETDWGTIDLRPNVHNPDPLRETSKAPCCQEVLDRMMIKWRFGIISSREPTPEPTLPEYPPGWSGGNGGGGNGGGSGNDHAASGYYHPPTDFGFWPSEWSNSGAYQAAGAYAQ